MNINEFKALPVADQKEAYLSHCEVLDQLNDAIQAAIKDGNKQWEDYYQGMADITACEIDMMDQIIGSHA